MKKENFNNDWDFSREGGERRTLDLPHDAMIEEQCIPDSPGGSANAYFPGGVYFYEKTFYVPPDWADKTAVFQFEGVYRNAGVFINDKEAGGKPYGYIPFFVNTEGLLRYGEENTIRVVADNSKLPNSRWYSGSGIYRPVWLWIGHKTHIDIEGVKISTLSYSPASVKIETRHTGGDVEAEILYKGEKVAGGTGDTVILNIPNAKLWSDETPDLYQCRVTLRENGVIVDEADETFGIRLVEWSGKGLFINGRNVKLRGGCVHHDNGILGACAYDEAEERRVRIIKRTGFNAVRSAHNPCSEAFLRACDKHGVYLIDEMWDMWYERKNRHDYALDFENYFRSDIQAVTVRDFNHPCVIMYSIGNENLEPYNEKGLSVMRDVVNTFRICDDTRPVTMGLNPSILYGASKGKGLYKDTKPGEKEKASGSMLFNMIMIIAGVLIEKLAASTAVDRVISPCVNALDITGYNYAAGRYKLDGNKRPNRLIYGSETMPYFIAKNWALVQKYDHVCGDFMWAAWDYLGEAGLGSWSYRSEAAGFNKKYPWKLSEAGAIDILGNISAEAVYASFIWGTRSEPYIAVTPPNHPGEKLHRAYWRGTNAVASWSWRGCDGNPTMVEVFAIGDSARLSVNGRIVGKKKLKYHKAKFKTKYQPGMIKAEALDKNGNILSENKLISATGDPGIALRPETNNPKEGEVVFIDVSLVGANGIMESNQDRKLSFHVDGGELLGFGSAEPCTEESYLSGIYTTYYGRAQAVVRAKNAGTLTIKAEGENLETVCACITVKAANDQF